MAHDTTERKSGFDRPGPNGPNPEKNCTAEVTRATGGVKEFIPLAGIPGYPARRSGGHSTNDPAGT